jgi:CIC family chloride channel protein
MLCAVIAYFTAKGLEGQSLYSQALRRKQAEAPVPMLPTGRVRDMMKVNPTAVALTASFAEIAKVFLGVRVNNLYVTGPDGKFVGAVSLHDIKPYLGDPDLAELVIASDIVREDFPKIGPDESLNDALGRFLVRTVERLPVVEPETGKLVGSLAKSDLLLALVERTKPQKAAA